MPPVDAPVKKWLGLIGRSVVEKRNGRRLKLVGDIPTLTTQRLPKNIPMCLWEKKTNDPHSMEETP